MNYLWLRLNTTMFVKNPDKIANVIKGDMYEWRPGRLEH